MPSIGAGIGFTVSVCTVVQPAVVVTETVTTPPGLPPAVINVVEPGPAVTVATVVLLLVHVPPGVLVLSVAVVPAHIWPGPDIGAGTGNTVTDTELVHPVPCVNVITVVPGAEPVTMPVVVPTGAITGELLLHVPPPEERLVSDMVDPTQTAVGPIIANGSGFTVAVTTAEQPARV
jgi:hypothetical protein